MGLATSHIIASPSRVARSFPVFLIGSLAMHGTALAILTTKMSQSPPAALSRPLDLVMVDVEPAPPPPPEAPKPEPIRPRARRLPIRTAEAPRPAQEPTPDPPPPNEEAQEQARPAPLVIGLSLSSTTNAGDLAAPTGNSLYGKTTAHAQSPTDVKLYSSPRYTPFSQLDARPEILSEPKIPYPEDAHHASIEGDVILSIDLDETGRVTGARIVRGPGHGLNEAARESVFKFKFKPATKKGIPTATTIPFLYHFVLN